MSTYSKIGDDAAKAIVGIPANALGTANNLVVATKKLTQGFSNESEGIGEAVGKTVATTGKLTDTAVKTTNEGVQIIGQTLNLGNEAIGGLSDYAQDKRKEKNLQRKIKQKAREDTQLEKLELNKLEMKLEYDKQKLIAEKKSQNEKNKIKKALSVIEFAADKAERDNTLLKNCFNKFQETDKSSKVIDQICKKQRKCLDWKDTNRRMYSWYNCDKLFNTYPELTGGKKQKKKVKHSKKNRRSKRNRHSKNNKYSKKYRYLKKYRYSKKNKIYKNRSNK